MNVSLTPQLEEFARKKVEDGQYQTTSEVVRAGLRLLIENDLQYQHLQQEVQKGHQQLVNGEGISIASRDEFLEIVKSSDGS